MKQFGKTVALGCALLAAGSLVGILVMGSNPVWRELFGATYLASLVGGGWKLFVTVWAEERAEAAALRAEERAALAKMRAEVREDAAARVEHAMRLSNESHMANVTFDKVTVFAQEYFAAVQTLLERLRAMGPHTAVLEDERVLTGIRAKHVLWVSSTMEATLDKFEGEVRKIGGNAVVQRMAGIDDKTRDRAMQRMLEGFSAVLGETYSPNENEKPDPSVQALAVMRLIRKHIGIDRMIDARLALLEQSDPATRPG